MDFMGATPCPRCKDCGIVFFGDSEVTISSLKYDSDWNLLMPVVEKIRIWCWDKYRCTDKMGEIFKGMHMTDIKRTHMAVVEFINWYNNNQPLT